MNKKCIRMSFGATFKQVNNVIQKFVNNSSSVIQEKQFTWNPLFVPEEVQADIPRFSAVSNGKHSQITISKVNCIITSKFDDNYSSDPKKCSDYFFEKLGIVSKVLDCLEINKNTDYKFLGITMELIYDTDNSVELIKKILNKINMPNICDADLQITSVVNNKYYLNIRISDYKQFEDALNPFEPGMLNYKYKDGIKVIIDINNRYLFSKGESSYICNFDDIEEIKQLLIDTPSKLNDYLGSDFFNE